MIRPKFFVNIRGRLNVFGHRIEPTNEENLISIAQKLAANVDPEDSLMIIKQYLEQEIDHFASDPSADHIFIHYIRIRWFLDDLYDQITDGDSQEGFELQELVDKAKQLYSEFEENEHTDTEQANNFLLEVIEHDRGNRARY